MAVDPTVGACLLAPELAGLLAAKLLCNSAGSERDPAGSGQL